MLEKTYELEQHTPILHFQSDNYNCGIRASEVKPLLDKFIIKKKGEDNLKKYFINGTKSLNYKMKFTFECEHNEMLETVNSKKKLEIFPCILANMGKFESDENIFKAVKNKNIKMKITTYFNDLIDFIDAEIEEFFILNNFGNRKSKGFGCVYIKNDFIKDNLEKNYDYKFSIKTNTSSFKEQNKIIFKKINDLWKYIKDDANLIKVIGENITEKAYFSKKKKTYENVVSIKPILGLAVEEDWVNRGKLERNLEYKNKDTNKVEKIERFMSPVLFKVFIEKNGNIQVFFKFDNERYEPLKKIIDEVKCTVILREKHINKQVETKLLSNFEFENIMNEKTRNKFRIEAVKQ